MLKIDPTLLAALNNLAESAVNKAIQLDAASKHLLDLLGECSLALLVTPPGLPLFVSFQTGKIRISTVPHPIQLRVSGAPLALAALIQSADEESSLARQLQQAAQDKLTSLTIGDVLLNGDLDTAVKIRHFLAHLELDLEAALADKIGDMPAHFIGVRLRSFFKWEKTSRDSIAMNIDEYVHEESRELPSRQECQKHHKLIDRLSRQTETLEERIKRLSIHIKNTHIKKEAR